MEIVRVEKSDLNAVMDIIKSSVEFIRSYGSDQWDENYPNETVMKNDIEKGHLYGIKDGELLGIIVLNEDQPVEYKDVSWRYDSDKILVVHRLAVHSKLSKKGVATKLMMFSKELAKEKGYDIIRLDVYSKNSPAIALYKKVGFKKVGQVFFDGKANPFYCYDKHINET